MGKHEKRSKSGGLVAALAPYSKALTGAAFGALAMWFKVRGHGITDDELWQILGAAASGGGLIWAVPNKDPKGKRQDESVQPPSERVRQRNEAAGRS